MSDFEETIRIDASAEDVFEFASDVRNLPRYLSTVSRASAQGGERVEMEGEVAGRHYRSDGDFHVDHAKRCMQWGSAGENQYRGWMLVGGRNGTCEVKVHISFNPRPDQTANFGELTDDRNRSIREAIRKALRSIKDLVEAQRDQSAVLRAA